MSWVFAYTESKNSGPFEPGSGFKVSRISSLDGQTYNWTMDFEFVRDACRQILSELPSYNAPLVSPYMSTEEFELLPKKWVYSVSKKGVRYFARLFTSGSYQGRSGNPYYQIVALPQSDFPYTNLVGVSVPAELFRLRWPNPRSEAEVENSMLVTVPERQPSNLFDLALSVETKLLSPEGRELVQRFARAAFGIPDNHDFNNFHMPGVAEEDFFQVWEILSHTVRDSDSWSICGLFDPNTEMAETNHAPDFTKIEQFEMFKFNEWCQLFLQVTHLGLLPDVLVGLRELCQIPFKNNLQNQQFLFPLAVLVTDLTLSGDSENLAVKSHALLRSVDSGFEIESGMSLDNGLILKLEQRYQKNFRVGLDLPFEVLI